MNHFRKTICLILSVTVFLFLLTGCNQQPEKAESPGETEATVQTMLQKRDGVQSVLVLCLDAFEDAGNTGGFRNGNRADFAMVMVIDEQAGSIRSLQLNPDTVVPFSVPGTSETREMPLGQIYSYGSGGSDSCLAMTKAVSSLLGGISIDHYLTFTRDAVGIVNDKIGGVTIPAETAGDEPAVLSGEEAMAFFFSREEDDLSNEKHMAKQRQYMAAMFVPFMACTENEDFLTKLSLQLGEKMNTGLTLSQLIQMFETLAAYTMDQNILTLPGSARQETDSVYFEVEKEAVSRLVEELFLAK